MVGQLRGERRSSRSYQEERGSRSSRAGAATAGGSGFEPQPPARASARPRSPRALPAAAPADQSVAHSPSPPNRPVSRSATPPQLPSLAGHDPPHDSLPRGVLVAGFAPRGRGGVRGGRPRRSSQQDAFARQPKAELFRVQLTEAEERQGIAEQQWELRANLYVVAMHRPRRKTPPRARTPPRRINVGGLDGGMLRATDRMADQLPPPIESPGSPDPVASPSGRSPPPSPLPRSPLLSPPDGQSLGVSPRSPAVCIGFPLRARAVARYIDIRKLLGMGDLPAQVRSASLGGTPRSTPRWSDAPHPHPDKNMNTSLLGRPIGEETEITPESIAAELYKGVASTVGRVLLRDLGTDDDGEVTLRCWMRWLSHAAAAGGDGLADCLLRSVEEGLSKRSQPIKLMDPSELVERSLSRDVALGRAGVAVGPGPVGDCLRTMALHVAAGPTRPWKKTHQLRGVERSSSLGVIHSKQRPGSRPIPGRPKK